MRRCIHTYNNTWHCNTIHCCDMEHSTEGSKAQTCTCIHTYVRTYVRTWMIYTVHALFSVSDEVYQRVNLRWFPVLLCVCLYLLHALGGGRVGESEGGRLRPLTDSWFTLKVVLTLAKGTGICLGTLVRHKGGAAFQLQRFALQESSMAAQTLRKLRKRDIHRVFQRVRFLKHTGQEEAHF